VGSLGAGVCDWREVGNYMAVPHGHHSAYRVWCAYGVCVWGLSCLVVFKAGCCWVYRFGGLVWLALLLKVWLPLWLPLWFDCLCFSAQGTWLSDWVVGIWAR
jgi:hypothetical protein